MKDTHTDRRGFLLGAAAAASGQAATAQVREVRTAHIGVGVRGGHLVKLATAQQGVKVSAICDIDPETRDRALSAASRDNPRSITEWRKVLDLQDVDAVFIGTPCDLHAEMSAACLEAGKHVYCEKPMAIHPEGVDRVLKAARRSKAIFQIGQQLRYFPAMREAIRHIHGGVAGRTYIIKAHRHSSRGRGGRDASTPQAKTRADWYADVRRSGDLLVENSVHNIDMCNWIADSRPESAYGHGKRYFPEPIPPGKLMMDGYSVEYIYQNDIHLDYSQIAFHPRQLKVLPNNMWYTIFGEKGSVFLTHSSATFYDLYGESEPRELLPAGKQENDTAMEDFLACVRENRQPFADVKVGAIAALTAILGREAIYRRRSVAWKELGVDVS